MSVMNNVRVKTGSPMSMLDNFSKVTKYPDLICQFCGGSNGHAEEVVCEVDQYFPLGLAVWFCCHDCRDQGEPCETFIPFTE